jgi:hypothetical protein
MKRQPQSVWPAAYPAPVDDAGTKRILWGSVLALMQHAYGRENLTRLARETGIGPGSATRIKNQDTSVGIDTIEKIANRFDVQPWQLLVPGFDPVNPPALLPVTVGERQLWERLLMAAKDIRQAKP